MEPIDYVIVDRALPVQNMGYATRLLSAPHISGYEKCRAFGVFLSDLVARMVRIGGGLVAGQKDNRQDNFKGWLNINLKDADKAQIEGIAKDVKLTTLVAWMAGKIYEGYRFSVSWDSYSDSSQIAAYCWDEEHPDYGHALSSRHPDLDMALLSLWYKHETIAQGVWTQVANPPTPPSWS